MEKIGFIGVGIMGKPMVKNLLKAGYPVLVNDVNPEPMAELVAAGAVKAENPKDAAQKAQVIITMLPDSPDVEAVVFGPAGLLEGVKPGQLYADMSSISPATARKVHAAMKAKGVDCLDAPVSGGEVGAINATLSIMVGAEDKAFERAKPIFEKVGKNIVLIGGPGAGQVCKVCNQIVVGVTMQAVAEAITLAKKAQVDPAKVRAALLGGFAGSRIMELHGQRMIDKNYKPGFKIKLHRKDLNIALQTGRELGMPLLATSLVAELMNALIGQGQAEADHSALAMLIDR